MHPRNVTMTAAPTNFTLDCAAVNNDDAANNLTFYWMENEELLENASVTTIQINSSTATSQLFVAYDMAQENSYYCIATNRELEDGTRSLPSYAKLICK